MSENSFIADPRFDEDRHVYSAPLSDDDMDAMFTTIAAVTVDDNPGVLGQLRQWSTPMRVAVGASFAASLSGVVVTLLGLRDIMTAEGRTGLLISMFTMAGLGASALGLSLRGLHRHTMRGHAQLFSGLVLLVPLILSLLLGLWSGGGSDIRVMPWNSGCFWIGVAVAMLSGSSIMALQRSRELEAWRVLTAAGAGGAAGFITQGLFCPSSDTWHLISTHGSIALLLAALLLIVQQIRQRL